VALDIWNSLGFAPLDDGLAFDAEFFRDFVNLSCQTGLLCIDVD
jgi:hypothetical protein